MAVFPRRPRTFFRVGPAELANPECFAVKRGEVAETRWDADFHHPEHSSLQGRLDALPDTVLISEIIASPLASGFAASQENRAQPDEDSVPQIRPTQILLEGGIDLSGSYGIGVQDIAERHYIGHGEVLFNNTNSTALVGKSAVFRESVPAVCSNHITRLRLRKGVEPEFVEMVLNLLQRKGYFARLCTNSNNQAGVNSNTLANVLIPFPPAERRKELVDRMLSARSRRNAQLAEADALLAGAGDSVLRALEIETLPEGSQRAFVVRKGDLTQLGLSPAHYVPQLQTFLSRLRSHPAATQTLEAYVDINPPVNLTGIDAEETVGFIPMGAVSDGATGEYISEDKPLQEVRKGYTPFADEDILWAKITPSMQNGKSCLVEGLPNGVGFGSTEFHVLRVKDEGISREFVREFVSQQTLRQVAIYASTGSAGQQRVPAAFLAGLPFPKVPKERQVQIVEEIAATREKARYLRSEAEVVWQEAKQWFEEQLLGPTAP